MTKYFKYFIIFFIAGVSVEVERTALVMPLRKDTAGSNPVSSLSSITPIMSLISQQDRALTIKALEHYAASFKDVMTESERAESNALLNWIKIEYNKHEH